jgi:LPXTG-site transpeptidase (sortase) family protein
MLYKYQKKEIAIKNNQLPSAKGKKNVMNLAMSGVCFLVGVSILFYSLYPHINQFVVNLRGQNKVSKSLLTPSPSEQTVSVQGQAVAVQDFSSDYISNVNRNFSVTNQLLNITPRTHPEYANIQGEMKITIPKLNIKNIPIKINVDSYDEASYMPLLDKTLAHFLGTSLPDKPGNTFIYGHSTNELWAKTDPSNPRFAFTFLNNLDIGDEIIVEYEGAKFTYSTQKIKMVTPTDISPIYTTSEAKNLTLMTCWPPGIGSERLIVTAKQVTNS